MSTRPCSRCGRPAEPPLTVPRSRLPERWLALAGREGESAEAEYVFCLECLQAIRRGEPVAQDVERQVLAGSICALCHADLDPPGGYAVPSRDGTRLFRLCASCRDAVGRRRGQAL